MVRVRFTFSQAFPLQNINQLTNQLTVNLPSEIVYIACMMLFFVPVYSRIFGWSVFPKVALSFM